MFHLRFYVAVLFWSGYRWNEPLPKGQQNFRSQYVMQSSFLQLKWSIGVRIHWLILSDRYSWQLDYIFLNVYHPTYCWPQRISSAYPVPKLKHIIFGIHSEFSHLSLICWKGYEMFGNSTFLLIQKLINNYVWYMYHEIITINYFLQFWSANW